VYPKYSEVTLYNHTHHYAWQSYHIPVLRATTTAVQMVAPVRNILDKPSYLKRGIAHFPSALEKVKKFGIKTKFRHLGTQAGLFVSASQQTAILRTAWRHSKPDVQQLFAGRRQLNTEQMTVFRVQVTKTSDQFQLGFSKWLTHYYQIQLIYLPTYSMEQSPS
jgi:hypothetical protein